MAHVDHVALVPGANHARGESPTRGGAMKNLPVAEGETGGRPEVRGAVLVIEDEEATREALVALVEALGCEVLPAASAGAALQLLETKDVEVVLLDLGLPDIGGLEVLPRLLQVDDSVAVIVVTGDDSVATVVEAMRLGAEGFLVKPVGVPALQAALEQALRRHRTRRHVEVYRARLACRPEAIGGDELVGSSPAMQRVRDLIAKVAKTDSSVVVTGESGSGKGVVARLIHRYSRRAHGPFVDLSCAALPTNLVESEIFGYERGAFTDAKHSKPGLLEVAHGGTLFLDEIGELEPAAQAKLLKVLEQGTFRRVGGVRELRADVRLIVATHRDLPALMAEGRFRADLYFRLNVFGIALPPLRERGKDDILKLAEHFVRLLNPKLDRHVRSISEPACRALVRYHWPGNVRELHNAIERAMILASGDELALHHLPSDLWHATVSPTVKPSMRLDQAEAEHISSVVAACSGNLKQAAQRLGIARSTLYAKLARYGLRPTP